MLRNNGLKIFGKSGVFPNNAYAIADRSIRPKNGTSYVKITLKGYTDETKSECFSTHKFVLPDLQNDQSQLNPTFYQTALIVQHGAVVVDGTALSDFEVLEDR